MHRRFLERGASEAKLSHSVGWYCACELPGVSPKTEYVGHRSPCRGSQTMPPPHQARGAQEVLTSLGCILAGAHYLTHSLLSPLSKFTAFSHSHAATCSVWGHCSLWPLRAETLVSLLYFIHHYYLLSTTVHVDCPPNTLIQGL